MKGYKAFDKDLKCRNFEFKVGHTYSITGELKICSNGFHFCEKLEDVYEYYPKSIDTRICEVEALGSSVTEDNKTATSTIKIIRELTEKEILNFWINKTNSGNRNSGNRNSGNRNSGDWNSGYGNSGYGNSGNRNSGYGNSGDWNSGYGNSGNRNSGDWNSGDGNSGYFNTKIPVYFFNKPSDLVYSKEFENKIRSLNVKPILTWVYSSEMTEEEKNNNPNHKITGGGLRSTGRHNFSHLTDEDKSFIKSLPNFDDEIFFQITGVRLLTPTKIKVIVNGVEKELDYEVAKNLGLID